MQLHKALHVHSKLVTNWHGAIALIIIDKTRLLIITKHAA